MSEAQRQARNIRALPGTLADALASLRNNPQLLEQLPPLMMEAYFALKAEELTSTEKLTPAELCDHYARLY
jgi:glutamine synthetase